MKKIREVVVLDDVSEDMDNGVAFYENQEHWIGEYFFDSIISDLESLRLYAGIHSKHFGYFRMPARRFPFAIYYEIINETAVVIAVLDMRRKPSWIKKELSDRS